MMTTIPHSRGKAQINFRHSDFVINYEDSNHESCKDHPVDMRISDMNGMAPEICLFISVDERDKLIARFEGE